MSALTPRWISQEEARQIANAWQPSADKVCKSREKKLSWSFAENELDAALEEDARWAKANDYRERLEEFGIHEHESPDHACVKITSSDGAPQAVGILQRWDCYTTIEISLLATAPQNLGLCSKLKGIRGAGTAAVDFAARNALSLYGAYAKVSVYSTDTAVGFYEKLGFVSCGGTYLHLFPGASVPVSPFTFEMHPTLKGLPPERLLTALAHPDACVPSKRMDHLYD